MIRHSCLLRDTYQPGRDSDWGGTGGEFRAAGSRAGLVKAFLKGIFDALRSFLRMLGKRQQIMKTRRLPGREFSALLKCYRISFRELLDID